VVTVAPIYTKLYQDESFSIHLNNHATNTSNTNIKASQISELKKNDSSRINTDDLNGNNDSTNLSSSKKLVLLSSNQQTTQVAKNPLLKWCIGSVDSSIEIPNLFSNANNAGINGVNEFAFSPCGSYLAIVSQDGFLRVFAFDYQNNQQLQIQLLCSMKSYFGGLLCCTWSSDGRYIATGGEDDLITVFSFVEMRVACRGRGHSSWINSCTFDAWTCLKTDTPNLDMISKKADRKKTELKVRLF
jgi:WD40 repeat protein